MRRRIGYDPPRGGHYCRFARAAAAFRDKYGGHGCHAILHANLGTASIYLQGIDTEEIIATVHARRVPMMPASAGLRF